MSPKGQSISWENEDWELISSFEKRGYRTIPSFHVNGNPVSRECAIQARPNMTLLTFLRTILNCTGTKLGCNEGGCGACTVLISRTTGERGRRGGGDDDDDDSFKIIHYSVNACLMPVLAVDNCHVTTIEGIGSLKRKQQQQHSNTSTNGNLHPIQQAMVDFHGSQCGFCTPGIIVSLYALLSNDPTVEHIEEHLDGNLCRCTGYRPIWDAARSLCLDNNELLIRGLFGVPCRECPENDSCRQDCNLQDRALASSSSSSPDSATSCITASSDKMAFYKDSFLNDTSWLNQPNLMFPKELLESAEITPPPLLVVDRTGSTWIQPTTLVDLLNLLDRFQGQCKLVVGNTEVGIEARFKNNSHYPRLISPARTIAELFQPPTVVTVNDDGPWLTMGSCCPLSVIQQSCRTLAENQSDSWKRTCMPIHDMLRWFASTQIRNVASLGGNLVTASPISDMNPILACMGAKLLLSSLAGTDNNIRRRHCPVAEFFVGYRTVQLQPNELVERIDIPILKPLFQYVKAFKQARRREDDISIVTSGMKIELVVRDGAFVIQHAALAFGGMAPKTVLAIQTAEALIGEEFSASTFDAASTVLLKELALPEAVPGGQAAYRMTLTVSFLRKFFLLCWKELQEDVKTIRADPDRYHEYANLPELPPLQESEFSGMKNFLSETKPSFSGIQTYPIPKIVSKGLEEDLLPPMALAEGKGVVVGKDVTHQSGPLHCTGEALYTDDIPVPAGTLHASLLLAKECGGVLQSIDVESALATVGVVAVFTHRDLVALGGNNALGPIQLDEVVFLPIGEVVRMVGQVLGIVVAKTLECAELGARLVKVIYAQPKSKVIVTIQDAIEANSFYDFSRHSLERGDVAALNALSSTPDTIISKEAPKVGDVVKVSGEFHSGAQEHFYLEPNGALVIPSEADTNLTIYCSTQAPAKTQTFCATATNTPESKVVVRVKRMGGGFGGKETRSVFVAAAVAVAAKILGLPVKCVLPRDVDMKITGTRHVFFSKYHASAQITNDGAKLLSMDIKLYNNGGCGFDLSGPVMDRALFHVDGCYNFPNFRCEGVACKTAQPPHTAFRGFGGPQGMAATEHVLGHLALACHVPIDVLRRSNMYQNGDLTPFGMAIGEEDSGKWNVPVMWDRMVSELNIAHRRQQIAEFNDKNKYLKRGLCILPTKFGIAYTAKYMNQGGALVHLYTDGTVLVTHGGTEMGQGLHTKVCQVVAQAFGIPIEDVYVNDSSTDKVANSIPTAASMSTDMYGMAALDACRQILRRIEPIRKELGENVSLKEIAKKAFMSRIDLSAHGFFAVNDKRCGFDWTAEMPRDFTGPSNSWKGHPFNYFTQGVACTEVEVDVLTGNHRTLRSDVVVDVGSSINPAIDIGQIEGAFTQGMGWSTIEDVVYGDDDHTWIRPRGSVFTTGPGTYKIPSFNDTPEIFNVTLLENSSNPFAVHSSKAVGEPPFFLGASVFYAIKDAILSALSERDDEDPVYFEMRMPATSERIRMYISDRLAVEAVSQVVGGATVSGFFQPQGSF